ncbi:MAG: hypothetical protein JWL67_345 [Solirubrobacterales bacterium]|jgi:hypothetical protein|nr:hypothetical protein [Solirubrobacterales bacterium]
MRSVVAAIAGALAALLVASMLGVASAEAPTGTPVRTVSVAGVASVPIAQGANAASATDAYRQGMAAAVADGQSKAAFLASKAGVAVGGVQNIAEGGGYIVCTTGEEPGYAEYQGEQPDFGFSPGGVRALNNAAAAPKSSSPPVRKPSAKHRKHKTPAAKKAAAATCTLKAEVSLAYSIG